MWGWGGGEPCTQDETYHLGRGSAAQLGLAAPGAVPPRARDAHGPGGRALRRCLDINGIEMHMCHGPIGPLAYGNRVHIVGVVGLGYVSATQPFWSEHT